MGRRIGAALAAALLWAALAGLASRILRPVAAPPSSSLGDSAALRFAAPPPRWLAWVGDRLPGAEPAAPSRSTAAAAAVTQLPPRERGAVVDRTPAPVLPLPAAPADPGALSRAAALLATPREGELGPYRYLGDPDPPDAWRPIAAGLDAAYRERLGLAPIGEPRETVVLFGDPERYRAFQIELPRLAGLRPAGHTASGLVALAVDASDPAAAEATLVHELVHLVNRRALGPALPPWLDEGLAEEFAATRVDPASGRFLWGERRPGLRRQGRRIETSGALAGLERLARALVRPDPPTLAGLLAREWQPFVADPRELSYPHAREWVGFLLAEPSRAEPFRAWLAGIARGGESDAASLERALGAPLAALEPDFRAAVLRAKGLEIDAGIAALTATGERVATP